MPYFSFGLPIQDVVACISFDVSLCMVQRYVHTIEFPIF